ncbi:hypothetical protein Tco_1510916 [Tanacetum coccineum]
MSGSEVINATPSLSDKLSLVTHHHLLMRVPVKLDLEDWNYGSWEYFFDQLCSGYDVLKFIRRTPTDATPTSTSVPQTLYKNDCLDCVVNDEDVVHYAITRLPEKYNQVCGYMHYQTTFPDLKTVRSLLVAEEMRLKTKEVALPTDSSSPMVLMAQAGTNRRPSNP